MGKSLEEYAAQNPAQEPEKERQAITRTARSYEDRQQEAAEAQRLKESITNQLEQGNAPEYILYTAIKAIGLLTHDEEWAQAGERCLDSVYEDLAQQSFIVDNAAVAAQRLDSMQAAYNDKLRRQLTRSISGYRRIEKALQEALQAVNDLEPQEDILT